MNSIPLAKAYEILENASAVIVDNVVTYPCLADLNGDPDNEFLVLTWTDDEGLEFHTAFREGDNLNTKVSGTDLLLIDDEGEAQITILAPLNIEASLSAT